jgi:acylphosphatase
VELLAYGNRDSIEKLSQWLWHGPKYAKVKDVKSVRLTETSFDTLKGFEVRGDG